MGEVADATEAALGAATHITGADKGAVEALRMLARKIDSEDALREMALKYAETDSKYRPPAPDNVSVPTYLKYCDALGLTPAGRLRLGPAEEKTRGKLSQLRAVREA